MNDQSSRLISSARCLYRTATGRQCASLAGDRTSGLCPRHAANAQASSPDFREALTRDAYNFQRSQGVNNSLGALYILLAEGRISARRASVLAYISSLLLRTLPAIDYDNGHCDFDDDETDREETHDDRDNEAIAESAAAAEEQPVPPGKDPLPATAEEFADAALKHHQPNLA